jgi:hypothetical protein
MRQASFFRTLPVLSTFVALLCGVVLVGCATRPSGPGTFSFAVIGDLQYNAEEEKQFPHLLDQISVQPMSFVMHLGDFKAGSNSPCTDALFLKRRDEFNRSAHPFIYTTGDNDWVDCRRPTNGAMDPLERLAKLREVFFAEPKSLGKRTIALTRQSDAFVGDPILSRYSDNVLWVDRGVVFVTLNIQGSNDNVGFDAANDAEQKARERANLEWLKIAMNRARGTDIVGLVVFSQANVGFEEPQAVVAKSAYVPFLRNFETLATEFAKPILYTHGDTHTFRIDKPFRNPMNGNLIANVKRLEGYGAPRVNWVRVTVDPSNKADPFFVETGGFTPVVEGN